jgi:hypothetical protein
LIVPLMRQMAAAVSLLLGLNEAAG